MFAITIYIRFFQFKQSIFKTVAHSTQAFCFRFRRRRGWQRDGRNRRGRCTGFRRERFAEAPHRVDRDDRARRVLVHHPPVGFELPDDLADVGRARSQRIGESGVVGRLQLEVLASRIDSEYGIKVGFEAAPFETARWVSAADPAELFGLDAEKLKFAKPNALIMHPGPMNRGVEIDSEVADDLDRSVIHEQVEMGVAVRMACLDVLTRRARGVEGWA